MNNRHFYEAPEAERLDVKFETNFLDSDPVSMKGRVAGDDKTAGDHPDFDLGNQYGTL